MLQCKVWNECLNVDTGKTWHSLMLHYIAEDISGKRLLGPSGTNINKSSQDVTPQILLQAKGNKPFIELKIYIYIFFLTQYFHSLVVHII